MFMMGMVINNCIIIRDVGIKVWFHDQQVGKLGSLGETMWTMLKCQKALGVHGLDRGIHSTNREKLMYPQNPAIL